MDDMKRLKTICIMVLAALGVAVLPAHSEARMLSEVGAIWVDSDSCTARLEDQLSENGFAIAGSPRWSDSTLVVDVDELDARFGAAARYTATLRDVDGRLLFSTSGRENSHNYSALCEDIGDDIAERLANRVG
jgi:hypothetical protein